MKAKLAIVVVFLAMILITEPLYRNKLFSQSVQTTKDLQSAMPNWMIKALKIETELGNGMITTFIIVQLILQFEQRWRVIYYTLILSLYIIINCIWKMLDEQGRPSWYDPSIVVGKFNCNLEFGNPSGHSFEAASASLAMYLDFVLSVKERGRIEFTF